MKSGGAEEPALALSIYGERELAKRCSIGSDAEGAEAPALALSIIGERDLPNAAASALKAMGGRRGQFG